MTRSISRVLLPLLLLSGCTTARPREIAGWSDWLCVDQKDGQTSYWYLKSASRRDGHPFAGTCDSWARSGTPPDPSQLTPFHSIEAWPDWLCADFKDHRAESVWRPKSAVGGSDAPGAAVYPGRCAEWAEKRTINENSPIE